MRFTFAKTAGAGLAAMALLGTVTAGTASAAEIAPVAKPASVLTTPNECEQSGQQHNCWDYVDWFWTYSNCRADPRNRNFDHSKYDTADCFQFSGGLNVGLYWHRP
ncbi:hypothetical protein [Amycolatopsis sp. NPDC004378]